MAAKGVTTRGAVSVAGRGLVAEELVDVFLDTRVRDSLTQMLSPFRSELFSSKSELLSSKLDSKFTDFQASLDTIVTDFKSFQTRFDKVVEINKKLSEENKALRKEL